MHLCPYVFMQLRHWSGMCVIMITHANLPLPCKLNGATQKQLTADQEELNLWASRPLRV